MTDERLSRPQLRAMRDRWERDLAWLEKAYPVENWKADAPHIETQRNLATAIAQIEFIIACHTCCKGDPQP